MSVTSLTKAMATTPEASAEMRRRQTKRRVGLGLGLVFLLASPLAAGAAPDKNGSAGARGEEETASLPPLPAPMMSNGFGELSAGNAPAGAVPWASLAPPPELGGVMLQGGGGGGPAFEYYALDALGSVRVVFDAAGAVKARADYEPFGAAVMSSTMGPLPREQFTGQQRDSEVGLDYFGARFYHATHGRMLSVDPLYVGAVGDPQRWNRYAYALNSPIVMVDPDGRTARCTPTSTTPRSELGSCTNGGGTGYHGGDGPSVNTPSPGQPPLLGGGGIGSDWDYFDVNYGPGYRPDPMGGVRVARPATTTTTTTEVGEQIIEGGDGITVPPPVPPAPPDNGLVTIVRRFAPLLARVQSHASMLLARVQSALSSRPSVISYADKVWKADRNHSLPTFFDKTIVRSGWIDPVSPTYSVFRMPATLNRVDGIMEVGGNISGNSITVTHRVFIPLQKYKGPFPWAR